MNNVERELNKYEISQMELELLQIFADHHYRQEMAIQKFYKERREDKP